MLNHKINTFNLYVFPWYVVHRMLSVMNFPFAEYLTVVSLVRTESKSKWSATQLEQWKRPSGKSNSETV